MTRPSYLGSLPLHLSEMATIGPSGFRDRRVTGMTRSGRQTSPKPTSGQLLGPASSVSRCSMADESHEEFVQPVSEIAMDGVETRVRQSRRRGGQMRHS